MTYIATDACFEAPNSKCDVCLASLVPARRGKQLFACKCDILVPRHWTQMPPHLCKQSLTWQQRQAHLKWNPKGKVTSRSVTLKGILTETVGPYGLFRRSAGRLEDVFDGLRRQEAL